MNLSNNTLLQGGKYKIVRFISAGGFGCTYEGVHTMLDTHVAIKEFFVKDFCNRDEQTSHVTVGTQSKVELVQKLRNKFVDEAKALYKMQHPNIVRVLDIFEENGTAYYVMDYIDGQSLHEIVKERGALPEQEVLKYVEQIADALENVHSQNRLHLDIKPGNIMVDKLGKVKLIDFGASKQYDEVDGENTSTLLGKTPGYAPIEQMGNTVRTFTPATDIYALGATMYKCLTGNTPPDATLLMDEGLDPFPTNVSINTQNAIEKAMEVSKKNRPQTIAEFVQMLKFNQETISSNIIQKTLSHTLEEEEKTIIITDPYEKYKGKYIDLGLSVYWSVCNFGAQKSHEIGKRIGWGDSIGNNFSTDLHDYPFNLQSISGTDFDITHLRLGEEWRMPTSSEFQELIDECTWHWVTLEGISGYEVTGKNNNTIFLPVTGYRSGKSEHDSNDSGYYWSGTLSNFACAKALNISPKEFKLTDMVRYMGHCIRPILQKI